MREKKQKKDSLLRRAWHATAALHSAQALYYCGLLIVLFVAMTISVAALGNLFRLAIGVWTLPLSLLLTLGVYCALCCKTQPDKEFFTKDFFTEKSFSEMRRGIYSFLLAFAALTLLCGLLYEVSWDGNAYHKPAVGALANGWNPMVSSIDDYLRANNLSFPASPAICVDHYAKATWLFAASVYKVTGNIECGKVYHPLMALALFCIAAHYFLQKKSRFTRKQAITLAALAAVNPITLPQLLTYTNDGILCSTLFIVILSLGTLTDKSYTLPKPFQWCAALCGLCGWLLLLCKKHTGSRKSLLPADGRNGYAEYHLQQPAGQLQRAIRAGKAAARHLLPNGKSNPPYAKRTDVEASVFGSAQGICGSRSH